MKSLVTFKDPNETPMNCVSQAAAAAEEDAVCPRVEVPPAGDMVRFQEAC